MMSDRRHPPREEWNGSRSSDRSVVGRKKVEELQRQIAAMETDMKGRSDLIHKLNRLQEIEREKRVVEERVLERNNSRNSSRNDSRNNSRNNSGNGTPRLLHSEMQKNYRERIKTGADSPAGVDRHMIETVIKHRTKEFSAKQQEAALKAKYLDKERQRLQEARRLVEEQRLALAQAQSPEGKPLFRFHNDKLNPRYEPYHFSEDKERRFKDSLALPIQVEVPKTNRVKLKVKFVPVSIEERDLWKDYHKQMLESNEVEVDDAVAAFQRLTKKPKPKKKWNLPLQYVPYFDRDYRTYMDIPAYYPIADKDRVIQGYSSSLKVPKMAEGGDGGKFKDTMKFTATHDQYRDSRKRDGGTTNLPDLSQQKSQNSNIVATNDQQEAQGKQMKVKYRATPAYF